jgi:hypothetical protein
VEPANTGGNALPDPWSGWGAQAHPNSGSGGGGPGKFKTAGPLGAGIGLGGWHGLPHPLAPGARYLAVSDVYSDLGAFPQARIEEDRGVYFVSLPSRAAMRPFMRTFSERFENTVKRVAARSHLAVVINGNMYSDDAWDSVPRHVLGKLGVNISPQDPKLTTPEGKVVGRGQVLGGKSEKEMFYVAWVDGPLGGYSFGKGDPPGDTTSAIGGAGPLIIGGLRYGVKNQYRQGAPAGLPVVGEPEPKFKHLLEIRSNRTYASLAEGGVGVGKVIVGFGRGELPLKIVVQRDGVEGVTLDAIRDKLFHDGVANAVFLDGSDSALLFANGRFYVQQGTFKDRTNTVGIGFQVPFSYVDPPGRSLGNIA